VVNGLSSKIENAAEVLVKHSKLEREKTKNSQVQKLDTHLHEIRDSITNCDIMFDDLTNLLRTDHIL